MTAAAGLPTPDIETVVIGAGAVGLAVARALAAAGQEVFVLERHDLIGSETSSRNSEVIHAGLYYPPGSLRARFCVAGKQALYRFCAENGVTARRCGKLLVAADEAEIPRLEAIMANARQSGVEDLVPLTVAEARALEPEIACAAACLSPSTGVIDSHGLMTALEGHIASRGGQVVLNTLVQALSRLPNGLFQLTIETAGTQDRITARRLVNAAGLGATAIGDLLHRDGSYRPPRTYPAKGHYFQLLGRAPFKHLIYPLPQSGSLGRHLTLDHGGKVKFGPDIEWLDTGRDPSAHYDFDDPDGSRLKVFEEAIRGYWPGLPDKALAPDYVGLRPKITRQGEPAADFAVHGEPDHGIANLVGLYGIESPGLTSSLAIADHVAEMLA